MRYTRTIITAIRSLRAHTKRSALTMLGVVIGIASVVLILSVGKGAESLLQNQVASIGSNLVVILPGASEDDGPPASVFGISVTTLKQSDVDQVEREIPIIIAASGYVQGRNTVVYANQTTDTNYYGIDHSYLIVEDASLERGRFFTSEEQRGLARVVILGNQVSSDLFADADPIGEKIRIGKEFFTVIGVMQERGVQGFVNQDRQIFMPLDTAQKIMLGIDHLSFARLRVQEGEDVTAVAEQVRLVLRDVHEIEDSQIDDFSVRAATQALELLGSLTGVLSLFLVAISSVSLVVGGVGIMNIMLVSVSERIAEIGLRKSIGARREDIEQQFLVEAMLLTCGGALIGIVIGVTLAYAVSVIAQAQGYSWSFIITPFSLLLSLVMAVIIGLSFGYYPAARAARLDPIDALRYE